MKYQTYYVNLKSPDDSLNLPVIVYNISDYNIIYNDNKKEVLFYESENQDSKCAFWLSVGDINALLNNIEHDIDANPNYWYKWYLSYPWHQIDDNNDTTIYYSLISFDWKYVKYQYQYNEKHLILDSNYDWDECLYIEYKTNNSFFDIICKKLKNIGNLFRSQTN